MPWLLAVLVADHATPFLQCFKVGFVPMLTVLIFVCGELFFVLTKQKIRKLAKAAPPILLSQATWSQDHPGELAACSLVLSSRRGTSTSCFVCCGLENSFHETCRHVCLPAFWTFRGKCLTWILTALHNLRFVFGVALYPPGNRFGSLEALNTVCFFSFWH